MARLLALFFLRPKELVFEENDRRYNRQEYPIEGKNDAVNCIHEFFAGHVEAVESSMSRQADCKKKEIGKDKTRAFVCPQYEKIII